MASRLLLLALVAILVSGSVGVYSQTPSFPLTTALASARGVGTLATLARASGFLQILAEDTAFTGTLFLPNDLAFSRFFTAAGSSVSMLKQPSRRNSLLQLLFYHVVPGAPILAAQVGVKRTTLDTAFGNNTISVQRTGDVVSVASPGATASVVRANIKAGEGVIIHLIDRVLLPKTLPPRASRPPPSPGRRLPVFTKHTPRPVIARPTSRPTLRPLTTLRPMSTTKPVPRPVIKVPVIRVPTRSPTRTRAPTSPTKAPATGPMFPTLLAAVTSTPPISTLAQTVGSVGTVFGPILSQQDLVATVFAPSNDAFSAALALLKLDEQTFLAPANQELLIGVLTYHVVLLERVLLSQVKERAGMQLMTVAAQHLQLSKNASGVYVSGALNTVRVMTADITAGKAVMHVVDGVLLPPSLQSLLLPEAKPANTAGTLAFKTNENPTASSATVTETQKSNKGTIVTETKITSTASSSGNSSFSSTAGNAGARVDGNDGSMDIDSDLFKP